ncbi:hypothetical protein WDU94_007984 [Cyamophila willieti]
MNELTRNQILFSGRDIEKADKSNENSSGEHLEADGTNTDKNGTNTDNNGTNTDKKTAERSNNTTNTTEKPNTTDIEVIELTEVKDEPVEENHTAEYSNDDCRNAHQDETVEDITDNAAVEDSSESFDPDDASIEIETEVENTEKEPVDIWDADGNRKCSIYCPEIINKDDFLEKGPYICPICPNIVLPCEHLVKEHMSLVHGWFKAKRHYYNN